MFFSVFACLISLISIAAAFDYCSWTRNHVLCNTSHFEKHRDYKRCHDTINTTNLSGGDEGIILEALNHFREFIAKGKIPKGRGFSLGEPAANMMKMKWDEELALMATKMSRFCKPYSHCYGCLDLDRFPATYVQSFSPVKYEEETPLEWYSYIQDVFMKRDRSGKLTSLNLLTWAEMYMVGCGLSVFTKDGNKIRNFVCTFGPMEFEDDEEKSIPGPPCSSCPIGSKCSSNLEVLCDCETVCYPFKYKTLKRVRRQDTTVAGAAAAEGSATTAAAAGETEAGGEEETDAAGEGEDTGATPGGDEGAATDGASSPGGATGSPTDAGGGTTGGTTDGGTTAASATGGTAGTQTDATAMPGADTTMAGGGMTTAFPTPGTGLTMATDGTTMMTEASTVASGSAQATATVLILQLLYVLSVAKILK